MNDSQKETLRIHNPDLVHDLDLTATLIAKFIHHGLFNEDKIEEIKAERTRPDRVQKVLLELPRRGPRAFDMFVYSIQDSYPWLAEKLRKTHHKISLKAEHEISLKEKVDIFVHEHFGNSKRFSEEDKKDIRKFLYKHLKGHSVESDHLDNQRRDSIQTEVSVNLNEHQELHHEGQRRDSIQTEVSVNLNELQEMHHDNQNTVEKDTERKVLQRVYKILKSHSVNDTENFDAVDSGPVNITIETIEEKLNEMNRTVEERVSEMNRRVETLQNEINQCFSVLGLQNCEYSLHEVLGTYVEKRQKEVAHLGKLRDRLDTVERQRHKLEEKLRGKEKELQQCINDLKNVQHKNEKACTQITDLTAKCERLEQLHLKHMEKQQTLMTLKSMVQDLSPGPRQAHKTFKYTDNVDEVDGPGLRLPKVPAAQTITNHLGQSRKSGYRDRSNTGHHHNLHASKVPTSGYPWKY